MNRNIQIYDIEIFKNFYCCVLYNIDTKQFKVFEISERQNDIIAFKNFVYKGFNGVGFNNLNYDYPIIHYLVKSIKSTDAQTINKLLYEESQRNIAKEEGRYNRIYFNNYFNNLDLAAIHHFDNKAKRQSLKGVQFEMGSKWVQDLPYPYNKSLRIENFDVVIEYCKNDVLTTKEFFDISIPKIRLRNALQKKYPDFKCINMSDSSLGEQLVLHLYSKKTGIEKKVLKELRSTYTSLAFNDLILPYIKFKTDLFNEVLDNFKKTTYIFGDEDFSITCLFQKNYITYGLGGIHFSLNGIYEESENIKIYDDDVTGYYPNIPIKNRFYIKHLGEVFLDVYEKDIVEVRNKLKEKPKNQLTEEDLSLIDGFKLASNSVYGKSNDAYSFLNDVAYTYKTTINGQLSLTMFIEDLWLNIPSFKLLQANTDGFTYMIANEDIPKRDKLKLNWETTTKLNLETVLYRKMILRDCNNYIAISKSDKYKLKGAYEVEPLIGNERVYHKDSSFKIVQMATLEYFKNNIDIEEYITNHKDIKPFLGRQKFNRDSEGYIVYYLNDMEQPIKDKTQKVTRYYIANTRKRFVKAYKKGTEELINKGYFVEICQVLPDEFPTNINYDFYIAETRKLIMGVIGKEKKVISKKSINKEQLKLF